MYLKAYNSRTSYLNGLLSKSKPSVPWGRSWLGAFDSRVSYLNAYNSRQSYLNGVGGLLSRGRLGRGLGQDGSDEDFSMTTPPDIAAPYSGGDSFFSSSLFTSATPDINSLPDLTDPSIWGQSNVPSGPIISATDVVTPMNQPTSAQNANTALTTAAAAAQTAAAVAKLGANYGSPVVGVNAAASGVPFLSQSSLISGMSNGSVLLIFGGGILALTMLKKK